MSLADSHKLPGPFGPRIQAKRTHIGNPYM